MPLNILSKTYDEETLIALEQAIRDIQQVLKARDPSHDWDRDSEFQQGLALTLLNLVDAGVTDPQELCRRALTKFDLKPPH